MRGVPGSSWGTADSGLGTTRHRLTISRFRGTRVHTMVPRAAMCRTSRDAWAVRNTWTGPKMANRWRRLQPAPALRPCI